MLTQLIALPSLRLERSSTAALPARIKLLAWGENKGANGNFICNAVTKALLPVNQRKGFETVALDFEHNTVPGSPTNKGEPQLIAGNGTPEVVEGEGLYLNVSNWTPDGEKFGGEGHYIDVSPVLGVNARREVIFLHSAGLCRNGAIPGITLFPNAIQDLNIITVNYKLILCSLLGLTEAATDSEIQTAIDALSKDAGMEACAAAPAIADLIANAAKAKAAEPNADVTALRAELAASQKAIAEIQGGLAAAERQRIVANAAQAGKVIEPKFLTGELALNNAQLLAHVESLAPTVPLEQRTHLAPNAARSGVLEANSADEQVRKGLGISEEAWKKHNAR